MNKTLVWIVGILFVTIVALRLLGRVWWCETGTLIPWTFDSTSESQSQVLLDWYTFSHVLHGIFFFSVLAWITRWSDNTKMLIALSVEAFWEFIENTPLRILH